jgi:hypothetical protein
MIKTNPSNCLRMALLAMAAIVLAPGVSRAVPSFARQTGLSCEACHTEFPVLTDFGRDFKLNGYTMSTGATDLPPLAVMLQPSFTQTNQQQVGGAGPHFGPNSNVAITQASFFYSGRLFGPYTNLLMGDNGLTQFLNKFGIFSQTTYDGIARELHWDNTELRYADSGTVFGKPISYGAYVNNNPTMDDLWNTTPAWGYPFSSSGLAPTPEASTLIEGGLAQQVIGLGVYAMYDQSYYLSLGGYHTLDTGFQRAMGISTDGETQIPGVAPYWRLAYTKSAGNHSLEVGMFGLDADDYPGRVNTDGMDHMVDLGVDSEYQTSIGKNGFTGLVSLIHEWDKFDASQALGNSTNKEDNLWSFRGTVDYLYDETYGFTVSYFLINGRRDYLLYASGPNGSPETDGVTLQLNYLPFNNSGGPSFWPKSNVKFSIQYVIYNRFDGTHYQASNNNTLYVETWIAF